MITQLSHLNPEQQSQVLSLIASATDNDGVPPVSEHVLLHLRHGGDKADTHFISTENNSIVGYAHLDLTDEVEGPSAELVVHPAHRKSGIGQSLLKELQSAAGTTLRLWSHGDLPGAKNIAEQSGFTRVRTVIQMRRSLNDPIPELSKEVQIRNFLPGIDNQEWVALNNRAFADHPEQGNWSQRDLEIRTKESWFDPQGFLIAEEDQKMTGFCWTKIHGGHTHKHSHNEAEHDHDPIGEIYIMGVDPSRSGKGIGKAVTVAGLRYMRYQGIFSAMLYVDADNVAAIKLYQSLGFTEWGRDVLYRKTL
ncbi:MAG: mycothiol synthase [Actinomycetota bacterium]